jgi:hypothetical protein
LRPVAATLRTSSRTSSLISLASAAPSSAYIISYYTNCREMSIGCDHLILTFAENAGYRRNPLGGISPYPAMTAARSTSANSTRARSGHRSTRRTMRCNARRATSEYLRISWEQFPTY